MREIYGFIIWVAKNGVISEHTREAVNWYSWKMKKVTEQSMKTLVMKQIAKVKSRMAASAANHEGYLQKLPQTIIGPGSKQRRNFKQSGVWKRRFFVLKPVISTSILETTKWRVPPHVRQRRTG